MTILRTCLHVASNLKVTPRLLNFFRICCDARIFLRPNFPFNGLFVSMWSNLTRM